MDDKRQIQKELFEEFGNTEKRRHPKNLFEQKPRRTIALLYEHLAFIVIAIIIFSIIIFSLGVERGKSIGMKKDSLVTEQKEAVDEISLVKTPQQPEEMPVEEKEDVVPEFEQMPLSGYTVQVASYTSEDFANGRVDKLRSEGYEAFTLHKGSYYIMCIGKFRDKENATFEMKKLRKQYSDCLVRKIT